MNTIKNLLSKIVSFFKSGQAEKAFDAVAALVPKALPIVQAIASITPNQTVQEIASAYAKYGVPYTQDLQATPAPQRGYTLLHLATEVLAHQVPGAATKAL